MLGVEPATRQRTSSRRIGLALAGGGPLGSFYQLGALHALAECIDGLELGRLHGYVGVSSGAIISACLANGLSTNDLIRSFFMDGENDYPLVPAELMRPAFAEYARRLASIPRLLGDIALECAHDPLRQSLIGAFKPLLDVLPTGLFDNSAFERFMRRVLTSEGRTNDFRKLPCLLRIIATDLNEGTEARFGEPGLDHVPISQAIRASTALPGLYTPVVIDGRTYVDGALLRTMHASLVLESGADLVISVNPLVTLDATRLRRGRTADLATHGFAAVMNQTFRALIQSRMEVGMAQYHGLYPFSDRLLLQPDRGDETMFFVNVFRYHDRSRLAEHAYQTTRRDLRAQATRLTRLLARHGLKLNNAHLNDRRRRLLTSATREVREQREVFGRLDRTLTELSTLLRRAQA